MIFRINNKSVSLFTMILIFISSLLTIYDTAKVSILLYVLLMVVIIFVFILFTQKQLRHGLGRIFVMSMLVLGLYGIYFWGVCSNENLKRYSLILMEYAVGYLLCKIVDDKMLIKLYQILLIAICCSCIFGIYEMFIGENPLKNYFFKDYMTFYSREKRICSTFAHPIIFSSVILCGEMINEFIIKNKTIKLLIGVILIMALYGTKSRSSWIIVTVFYLIKIIKRNSGKIKFKYLVVASIFIVVCLIFLPVDSLIEGMVERLNMLQVDAGSSSYRFNANLALLSMPFTTGNLHTLLLGIGFNKAASALATYGLTLGSAAATDNQILAIFCEFGVIGFTLFIFSILYIFRKKINPEEKVSNCSRAIIVVLFFMMFFYDMFFWDFVTTLLCISIGIFVGHIDRSAKN